MTTHTLSHGTGETHPVINRILAATWAVLAYGVGMFGLFWVILAAGGLAPHGLTSLQSGTIAGAVAVNVLLVFAFATQHTIMARRWFKEAVARIIPQPVERSTFVFASGIAMAALVYFWQSVPGTVWSFESTLAVIVTRTIYVIGIVYLVGSSFVTNHFELFGLRQAWLYCTGQEYSPVKFRQNWTYRYSRHPMMLGLLLAFWSAPDMSATRFLLASLLTLYIFIGIRFEERSLVQEFGERYREYQRSIGLFFTLKK